MCGCAAKDCTTAGCIDAILVNAPSGLDGPSSGILTVCVDSSCKETAFDDGAGHVLKHVPFDDMEPGQQATAELVMPDGTRYEAVVKLETSRPNGPGCGPVCVQADLTLGRA